MKICTGKPLRIDYYPKTEEIVNEAEYTKVNVNTEKEENAALKENIADENIKVDKDLEEVLNLKLDEKLKEALNITFSEKLKETIQVELDDKLKETIQVELDDKLKEGLQLKIKEEEILIEE